MEWYDDRNKFIRHEREPTREAEKYKTPRDIYNYLDERIWKNTDVKRASALILWKCLHGIRQNCLIAGPTSSGKTATWLALQELFGDRIFIMDSSSITQDGWKGSTKWSDILRPVVGLMKHTIIVLDEADKMIAPKFSSGENVSFSIMSEGLKILEGTSTIQLKDGKDMTFCVDTRKISFVLCGAFSTLADDIAEKDKGTSIGFGSSQDKLQPYYKPLTMQDVIDYGMTPEFAGRLGTIVNTTPLDVDDYAKLLAESRHSPIQRLEDIYGIKLCLSEEKKLELAQNAYDSGLGVREITNQLTRMVDDVLFEDCETNYIEIY